VTSIAPHFGDSVLSRREVVSHPHTKVIRLDRDPRILAIAARKGCVGRQRPLARLRMPFGFRTATGR